MITEQEFKNYITNGTLTLEICKEWIESGGDINIQDQYGNTALIRTSSWGKLEIIQYLVEKGANIYIKNDDGSTALYYQYKRKNIQGIKIFLQSKQYSNKIKGFKRKNISFNKFILK